LPDKSPANTATAAVLTIAVAAVLVALTVLAAAPLATASPAQPDPGATPAPTFGADQAARFAELALSCVHQEYPNKIAHVLQSDEDVAPPRELSPAFYGCYDWHSSVHGHWLLARLARNYPDAPFAAPARAALAESLTRQHVAAEVAYLEGEGRVSFERPYGLAWLLQLAAELRGWAAEEGTAGAGQATAWAQNLAPLEAAAAGRFAEWLPKLTYPIRTGEHSQTAFAFGLLRDWAVAAGDDALLNLLDRRVRDFHLEDRDCPLAYEPGGQDFLSPCLAEADLLRRLLPPDRFAAWLSGFLPSVPMAVTGLDEAADASVESPPPSPWLPVAVVSDPSDPKLAHLDGLNLARAWMLEGIAAGLPGDDPRLPALADAARRHREAGLSAVTGEHYEGGHWLGSFATYLVTRRGLAPDEPAPAVPGDAPPEGR